jgi:rhodanese-related sulfurtransferase
MKELTPQQAQDRLKAGARLIDVRENTEYQEVHAEGAQLMPLSTFEQQFSALPKDAELVMICRSGARSEKAAQFLEDQGYHNVSNLVGGTVAWVAAGLPNAGGSS